MNECIVCLVSPPFSCFLLFLILQIIQIRQKEKFLAFRLLYSGSPLCWTSIGSDLSTAALGKIIALNIVFDFFLSLWITLRPATFCDSSVMNRRTLQAVSLHK